MSKLPKLRPSLLDYLTEQKRGAARQARTSAFARSGTSVTAEGVTTVDGELDVTGTLDVTGPLAVHGTAAFDGNTTIGGNAAITGTLSLPAGIIDNAALASPITAAVGHNDNGATNFAVTTTRTTVASYTFTVPAGFTRALILAVAQADAVNTTAAVDTLVVGAYLNGTFTGIAAAQDVAPGGFGGATKATARLLTGLTGGGTFTVSTGIYCYLGWASHAANSCNIDATVVYLR